MRPALAVLLFLVLAAPASGGGFATTGLSSLPDGTAPGEPWVVDVTVLAHGRTPLEGMEPKVTIARGGVRRSFAARPTARPGVYRARVVFPGAGRWRYAVDTGFGLGPETFPAVDIRTPAAPVGEGASARRPLALGAGLVAALLVAGTSALRPRPRPTAAR